MTSDSQLPETNRRMSVSLTGGAIPFVEGFRTRHPDTCRSYAEVVEMGCMLLKLSEGLGPNETLAVVNRDTGTTLSIILPWREDTNSVQLPPL